MIQRMIRVLAVVSVATTVAAATSAPAAGQSRMSTPPAQTTAAQAAPSPTVSVGGYLQAELDAGARGDSRFPEANRIFLRRGRLTVSGRAMPSVEFRIQGDFAGGLGSSSGVRAQLTDGYVEWTASPLARVRVGQFKSPFGAEFMTSSTSLLTVERSLTTDRLTLNRQIGVQVAGDALEGRVSYAAGLFNGNGRNVTVNDNDEFLYVMRGTAEPLALPNDATLEVGLSSYWSTDTALSMPSDFGLDSTPSSAARDNIFTGERQGVGVDGTFTQGPWRVDAEFIRARFTQTGGSPRPDVISRGWLVTPSVFVHRRLLQIVGRYDRFRPNTSVDDNDTTTWIAGLNYYANGNRVKLLVNYLWVTNPARPDDHAKFLAQLQVSF